jgi:23S rRNA pseudouridine2605 synthase
MNANPDSDLPEESSMPADAGDAAAKPVRRKRAVKAAVADDAHAPDAEHAEPAESLAAMDAVELAKPVRKRRTAAVKADDGVLVPAEDVPSDVAAPAPVTVAVPPVESANDASAPLATEGAEPQDQPGGESLRSERSRRRGRRDRGRGAKDRFVGEGDARSVDAAASTAAGGSDLDDDDEPAVVIDDTPAVPPQEAGEVFAQVLSGEFDVVEETPAVEPSAPPKRVLAAEPEAPKLHKVLAQAGVGSRRDMEQWIADGLVTVNGQPAHTGQRISFGDQIKVNGKPVRVRIVPPAPRIIAYHKPAGEVVTHDDPEHRPTVFRRLPRLQQGKWQSVGRLDLNTEGLLLFTNSGELANQLMHPRFGVEREYAVRVLGRLDETSKSQLLEGVNIDGQTASFRSIEDGGGEGTNHWYRVVITEGRNREVRKLFDSVELTVSRLIRIRYGTVVLPRGLKRGVWVDLDDADVRAIRRLAAPAGDGEARPDRNLPRDAPRDGRGRQNARNEPRNDPRGPRNEPRNDRGPRNDPKERFQNAPPRDAVPLPERSQPTSRADTDPDYEEEIDHSRIPNPLEQTFDKRFVQNPRTPTGGRGFGHGGGGFGTGGSGHNPGAPKGKAGGPREPDPMQTSVGYIGADAFHRKGNRGGGGSGGGGGRSGGGGGFGGGGRRGR